MPKVSPIQSSFSGGEVAPSVYGRVDVDRYKASMTKCLNYIPTIQGGLTRRPGTYFVSETKDNGEARLIPFEFSTTQAYMLEFGNNYIRFYKDQGIITYTAKNITAATQANPVVITSAAHGYSNGDRILITNVNGMTQLNNREFTVANVAANTFELSGVNGTGYDAYTSGGTSEKIYEISTTYATADLFQIKFTQSADVLYLVHPTYAPRKLSRTGDTSWTLSTIDFFDGPYLNTNSTTTTITPSGTAVGASITLTASAALFASTDVGRLVRIKDSTSWGYVKITAYTDSTHVTADVKAALDGTAATKNWRLGVWSTTTGFPGAVIFFEDRLFFAGCTSYPQRLDGSRSGDYENFTPTASDGTVTDSHAVSFSFNSNDVNVVRWMSSDEKGLLVGTVGGEWVVRPSSLSAALSPTNITAKRASSYGSANIQAIQIGKATMFAQRSTRKIRELTYFYDVDGFKATDITQLAEHITESGVFQLSYQKEPQSVVWAAREDGVLCAMTYERDTESLKVGWHRHIIGGTSDSAGTDAMVESIASIPSPDEVREDLWMVVKRYINGSTKRQIEYLTQIFDDTVAQKDAYFVDGGLTYDDPKTITGATKANPVVITCNSHGFSNGDSINITEIEGMTELNGNNYTIANVAANTFELSGVNGTSYGTYISGGEARKRVLTISGINHLEGETLSVLADGATQPNVTVTGGKITLSARAAVVQLGYGYNSDGQLLRLEAGAADGTALGKTRRINRVGFLLHRSLGLAIGPDFNHLTQITFRTSADPLTRAPALFSGIISETIDMDYDFENLITFRQSQPLPSMILAIMPMQTTQDR